MACRHDQVRGQHRLGGAHRPDVEVVDQSDAGQALELRLDRVGIDAARHAGQRHGGGLARHIDGGDEDQGGDDQAGHRVDPQPAGGEDQQASHHHACGHQSVGHHVQVGAANVDVALAPAREHPGGDAVDDDADAGDDHHRLALDEIRDDQPHHRIVDDEADRDQQDDGVAQRRQDGRAPEAVAEAAARRALGQPGRAPGEQQPEHVRQIVTRVGQQRDRIGKEAVGRLDRDEGDVEPDPDREGAAEAGGRVGMTVVP
jgi:hypothetical protein